MVCIISRRTRLMILDTVFGVMTENAAYAIHQLLFHFIYSLTPQWACTFYFCDELYKNTNTQIISVGYNSRPWVFSSLDIFHIFYFHVSSVLSLSLSLPPSLTFSFLALFPLPDGAQHWACPAARNISTQLFCCPSRAPGRHWRRLAHIPTLSSPLQHLKK